MIIIIIQDHAAYITDFIGGAQAGLGCERQSRILLDKGKCKIVNFFISSFFFSVCFNFVSIHYHTPKQ